MDHNPLVSIVIPTHNRKESVVRLISSILISTYKNIEIIVVDDYSKEDMGSYIKKRIKHKKVICIRNKRNLFTAETRNVGQKYANGDLILFIDDDNVVDKNMINEMVGVFAEDERVGEVGPINYSWTKKSKIFWSKTYRNMWTTKTYHLTSISSHEKYWTTPDVPNAFMVRSSIVKKFKIWFNPKYEIMYEESDYAYKIREAGSLVVVSKKAKIYHDIEEYSKKGKTKDYMYHFMQNPRRAFVFARNRVIFHKRFSSKPQFIFIVLFWIWFFSIYYIYKFVFYKGPGSFSLIRRLQLAVWYMLGTVAGVRQTVTFS